MVAGVETNRALSPARRELKHTNSLLGIYSFQYGIAIVFSWEMAFFPRSLEVICETSTIISILVITASKKQLLISSRMYIFKPILPGSLTMIENLQWR